MNLYVDISSGTLVQGIGNNAPANTIVIKSQDTLDVDIYLLSGGVVQNLGESPVLKFGLVAASAPTTLLVLESTFTRQVDPVNGVFYQALAAFNTTEMVAALAILSPLPAILEIRFQLADGEIIHTLDQLVTVDRTILLESGTTSPVGIESYPDASTLLVTGMKDQPSGVAALSSAGFLNPTDFDPSVVVLQSSRNVDSGFAGLDASALVLPAQLPIDGSTIISANGKISAIGPTLGVVSVTTQAFTTPSSLGGTVEIEAPVGSLVQGAYYLMAGVGLYQYSTPIDATHGTYTQIPAPASATPGTAVPSGQSLVLSGPPGAPSTVPGPAGLQFKAAWSSVTAYVLNDVVTLVGSSYICILGNTNQTPPNATYWALFTAVGATGTAGTNGTNGTNGVSFIWLGAWASGTAYVPNNVVSQAGSTWINVVANTGSTPSTDGGVHWALMAEVGSSTGDMTKAVYDTADRGYVDRAVLADTATTAAALSGNIPESQVTNLTTDLAAKSPTLVDAETSTGITMLGSTAGQVKRLIAGTNVTLDPTTTTGAVIINSSGGGGGSSGPFALITAAGADITYGDAVPITFTSAVSDTTSMWNGTTLLTVAATGIYLVHASFSLAWTTAGIIGVNIFRNWGSGGGGLMKTVSGAAGNVTQDTISGTLALTAGDTLCLVAFSSIGYSSGALPTTWKATPSGGANSNGIGPCQSLSILKIA